MAWFEDVLSRQLEFGGSAGAALEALGAYGGCMLFARERGVFRLRSRHGYSDPEAGYDFLSRSPGLLAPAFEYGHAELPREESFGRNVRLWAAVDRVQAPDHLLLAEVPAEVAAPGPLLRQLLVHEVALQRQRPVSGNGAAVDLPVWLVDLLPDLVERPSPLLILAEPGSGKEELVLAWLRRRFGSEQQGVFFHPGRLSQAVQLRELFGDPAGARLGGESPGVPLVEREERALVIQEAGDLASHAQLRILALFSSGDSDRFWVFESSRDLERMAKAERFLRGLYRILEAGKVVLPPLRVRKDRLEEEVERLLGGFRARYRRDVRLDSGALDAMLKYEWRGNWRELRNTLESAFLMTADSAIRREDLRLGLWAAPEDWDDLNLRRRSEEFEKSLLLRAYSLHSGNQVQMARALGISRGSLQYKLEKYGLN